MKDKSNIGIVSYYGGDKSAPQRAFDRLREKCAMLAALAQISAELDATLYRINPGEFDELVRLISAETQAADADIESMRLKVIEEQKLARQTQRSMTVRMSRAASKLIGIEAEKRVMRGAFPSAESLVSTPAALHAARRFRPSSTWSSSRMIGSLRSSSRMSETNLSKSSPSIIGKRSAAG
jgi:hypothetical protein